MPLSYLFFFFLMLWKEKQGLFPAPTAALTHRAFKQRVEAAKNRLPAPGRANLGSLSSCLGWGRGHFPRLPRHGAAVSGEEEGTGQTSGPPHTSE